MPTKFYVADGAGAVQLHDEEGEAWHPICSYFGKELARSAGKREAGVNIHIFADYNLSHSPDRVYGLTGAMDRGRFVAPDGAGHWCSFEPAELHPSQHLTVDLRVCCPRFKPTVLLDWLVFPMLHFGLAGQGCAPIHASGACPSGESGPTVFSAWSGVGKTNLVLQALSEGAEFYGDDQVIVDAGGFAFASDRRVSIYGYNRSLARGLSSAEQRRLWVGDVAHRQARRMRGRAAYLVGYAANGYGATRATAVDLGGSRASSKAVHHHVLCHSIAAGDRPLLSAADRDEAHHSAYASAHVAVMTYEYGWFRRFLQTWQWATANNRDPWQELESQWRENLESYFSTVPRLSTLLVPRATASASAIWQSVNAPASQDHDDK